MNGMEERGTVVTSATSVSSAPASSDTERQSFRGTETQGHPALPSSPASSLPPTETASGFQNQSGGLPITECTIIHCVKCFTPISLFHLHSDLMGWPYFYYYYYNSSSRNEKNSREGPLS